MTDFGSSGYYIGEEPKGKDGNPVSKIRKSKWISFFFFNPYFKTEREIKIRTRDESGHFKSRQEIIEDIKEMAQAIGSKEVEQMIEDFKNMPW